MTRALALLAAVATLGGCTKADLGEFALVEGLRLLGVQADPPEALPGDQVTLTAWVVDTDGGSIDVSWSACFLPSNGTANDGCTDSTGNGLVGLGSGATITMTVPEVDPAILGPSDATYGVYLPIVVHARANGDTVDSIYRLRLREVVVPGCTLTPPYPPMLHCDPNKNPMFSGIDPLGPDAGPLAAHEGELWALLAKYTDDSDETYSLPGNPAAPERLTTQWFATAGTFPDLPVGGTAVQKFTLDRKLPPSGGIVDLWIVGHDERGGTGMYHRSFVIQ